MRQIEILYQNGKFALLVDGATQPIHDEGDLLAKLIALDITKERAEGYIAQVKLTRQPTQVQ